MNEPVNRRIVEVDDVEGAYTETLRALLRGGSIVEGKDSKSVGANKRTKEILNYLLYVQNPRQRLTRRPINLPGAIARFVWMMGANNRLKDIEYYWGAKVTAFSDDGIIVPGSSYGERMLHPRPGVNQIEGIIERLKEDQSSRRAAVSIYQAEDAIRESRDIPCAFGLFYHIRDGSLHSSVVMRSNNAFVLLPYNLFEFTLLAEAVAAELSVPLGPMSYFALSMHVYESDWAKSEGMLENSPASHIEFPAVPFTPSPIQQIKELVKLEAEARHAAAGFNDDTFPEWIDRAGEKLAPYWRQPYYLLLLYMANKHRLPSALETLSGLITDPWRSCLPSNTFALTAATQTNLLGPSKPVFPVVAPSADLYRTRLESLEQACGNISSSRRTGAVVSLAEYQSLRDRLVGPLSEPLAIAAKGLSPNLTQKEVEDALDEIRRTSKDDSAGSTR